MKKKTSTLIITFLLIFLPILFLNKAFFQKNIIALGDFTGSDLLDLHYPFKAVLHENLPKGILPLWEANLALGFPLLAEGQSGVFYPPNLLLSFLPPEMGLNLAIAFSLFLAGAFTYLYARSLNYSKFSAFTSAIIFMFSAFFITRAKHVNLIATACWLPFIFWTIRSFFQKLSLRYALLAGTGIAFQFLAGHPQMTFFCLFVYLIYIPLEYALAAKRSGFSAVFPISSVALLILGATAFGLAAVQILPTLELSQLTERQEYTIQTATAYPFNYRNLISFISPFNFGNPATGSYRADIRLIGIFWENATYIGLLPLILALWAIITSLRKKVRPIHSLFFIGLALFSLILMLGRATPVFSTLWQLLPGFSLFRFPTRFNLFLTFGLALLAGLGANLLLEKLVNLRMGSTKKTTETDEMAFTWPLKTWQTQAAICAVILVDLYVFASAYLGFLPLDKFTTVPKMVSRLTEDKSLFRIYSLTQYGQSPYQALGWKGDQEAILAIKEAVPPNNNLLYGLASFSDRGWFEGGLSLKSRNRVENYLLYESADPLITAKILGLYNVKYIVSYSESLGIDIDKLEEVDLGKQFGTTVKLFKNNFVMPRVFYTPEAEVIKDEEAVLKRFAETEFFPRKSVILEEEPKVKSPEFTGALDTWRDENPVNITSYKDREVIISANIKTHGFLVLSDIYYPGWVAQVDGKSQAILKANLLVRGLELEPGQHTIRFSYEPLPFKIGAIVSIATLVIIGLASFAFFLWTRLRKKLKGVT